MHDRDAGRLRQQGRGQRAAERVFLFAQMTNYANFEARCERCGAPQGNGGLINHTRFCPQGRTQLEHALVLQHDEPGGALERELRAGIAANVAVKVGAGQGDQQRTLRELRVKVLDRRMAAARMQGEHEIGRRAVPFHLDPDLVPELAQHPRPAQRGIAIAVAGVFAGRGDKDDFHRGAERVRLVPSNWCGSTSPVSFICI